MNKLTIALMLMAMWTSTASARKDTIMVDMVRVAGPYVRQTIMTTTEKDANDKPYDQDNLQWDMPMDMDLWKQAADDNAHILHATDSTGFRVSRM